MKFPGCGWVPLALEATNVARVTWLDEAEAPAWYIEPTGWGWVACARVERIHRSLQRVVHLEAVPQWLFRLQLSTEEGLG